jgi:hypothetical protein
VEVLGEDALGYADKPQCLFPKIVLTGAKRRIFLLLLVQGSPLPKEV